jgi:hypothetical protein
LYNTTTTMADKYGKRKREDDGSDAPPNKHQKTEAAVDYSAHTYGEVDPNAYYDYSVSILSPFFYFLNPSL